MLPNSLTPKRLPPCQELLKGDATVFYTGTAQLISASGNAYDLYQDLDSTYPSAVCEGTGMRLKSLKPLRKKACPT